MRRARAARIALLGHTLTHLLIHGWIAWLHCREAVAFCMYNRYVDGLDTWQPRDEALYLERGKKTARDGYVEMSKEYLPAS